MKKSEIQKVNGTMVDQIRFTLKEKGINYVKVRASESGTIDLSVFDPEVQTGEGMGDGDGTGYLFRLSTVLAGIPYNRTVTAKRNRLVKEHQGEEIDAVVARLWAFLKREKGDEWIYNDLLDILPVFLISEGYNA